MVQNLTYELSVLAKAVQHKNLSAAAVHVGLSQPQLSRLVAKVEAELNIIILDRSARRKSGWTSLAHELSFIYSKGIGRLESEILALAEARELKELRIGSLEGLSSIAQQFAKSCFEQLAMHTVSLDLLDFRDLDSQFLSGNLDLIFTVRAPSKQKFTHVIEVGFQQVERVESNQDILVCSPYEKMSLDKKDLERSKHILISNSLALRTEWLHKMGGTGVIPVDAKKGKGKGPYSIQLIGSDLLSPGLWGRIKDIFTS